MASFGKKITDSLVVCSHILTKLIIAITSFMGGLCKYINFPLNERPILKFDRGLFLFHYMGSTQLAANRGQRGRRFLGRYFLRWSHGVSLLQPVADKQC